MKKYTGIFLIILIANSFAFSQNIIVWPGDANNDGIVNNIDILFVGKSFSSQGNSRAVLSNNWQLNEVLKWDDNLPNGLNIGYSDCSGNGFVNIEDALVIESNYGETNDSFNGLNFLEGTINNSQLTIIQNESVWEAGDTVSVTVFLNQTNNDSIYNIAFTFNYDTTLIKEAFLSMLPHPQFGGGGRQPIFVQKNTTQNGRLEFGISRTNNINHGGGIAVASASMIIEDNLIGKSFLDVAGAFHLSNIKMYNKDVVEIPVYGDTVDAKIMTTISEKKLAKKFSIYPVPSKEKLFVDAKGNDTIEQILLFDVKGNLQNITTDVENNHAVLYVNTLPNALYVIKVITANGVFHQKVLVDNY